MPSANRAVFHLVTQPPIRHDFSPVLLNSKLAASVPRGGTSNCSVPSRALGGSLNWILAAAPSDSPPSPLSLSVTRFLPTDAPGRPPSTSLSVYRPSASVLPYDAYAPSSPPVSGPKLMATFASG